MKSSKDFLNNTWRLLSSFLIVCWLIAVLYNYNKGTLNLVLLPAIISVAISIYSILNPQRMWPFALQATFWGLMYIYTSGKIAGFLLFFVGICLSIRCGFFKRLRFFKIVGLSLCMLAVLYHVYTIDPAILFDTLLDSIVVIIVIVIMNLLYRSDFIEESTTPYRSLSSIYSAQELEYIQLLIQDYKYYSMAQKFHISESSVKRIFANIYAKLNVKGKSEFLEELRKVATVEEKNMLNLN